MIGSSIVFFMNNPNLNPDPNPELDPKLRLKPDLYPKNNTVGSATLLSN
jgi:hypothetical protein